MVDWTIERISKIREMHAEGHPASYIAAAIGGGATRCAVIGKLHRLGLGALGKGTPRSWTFERDQKLKEMHAAGVLFEDIAAAIGVTRKAAMNRASKLGLPKRETCFGSGFHINHRRSRPRAPRVFRPLPETMERPSLEGAVPLLEVTGCKWPVTPHDVGKGEHLFCNHAIDGNGSYCPYHAAVNTARPEPRAAGYRRVIIPTSLLRVVA